ncbi:hypothetical protein D3C87_1860690 [compost metagenome]
MNQHPLELNGRERLYFQSINRPASTRAAAAYRRAIIACTGSMPSWCQYQKPGPKPKRVSIG